MFRSHHDDDTGELVAGPDPYGQFFVHCMVAPADATRGLVGPDLVGPLRGLGDGPAALGSPRVRSGYPQPPAVTRRRPEPRRDRAGTVPGHCRDRPIVVRS